MGIERCVVKRYINVALDKGRLENYPDRSFFSLFIFFPNIIYLDLSFPIPFPLHLIKKTNFKKLHKDIDTFIPPERIES